MHSSLNNRACLHHNIAVYIATVLSIFTFLVLCVLVNEMRWLPPSSRNYFRHKRDVLLLQNVKECIYFRINGNIRTFQDLLDHFVEAKHGTVDTSVSTNVMI